jgi:uncharacterized phiE125 gp8 family phage protein
MWKVWSLPPQPPVSTDELGQFLRLDTETIISEDAILTRMLQAATGAAEKYLGLAIDSREFIYTEDRGPLDLYSRNLRPGPVKRPEIPLPYTNLLELNSITIDGEALDSSAYTLRDGDPASVLLNFFQRGSLEIRYDAGYEYIPAAIEQGILMHAAYLYEHRGACDVDAALENSGAASFYGPYKVPWGVAL